MDAREEQLYQMIRTMHCDRRDQAGHVCVGECTIRRDGIELNCKLCGPATDVVYAHPQFHRLNRALRRLGIDSIVISPEVISAMLQDLYESNQ